MFYFIFLYSQVWRFFWIDLTYIESLVDNKILATLYYLHSVFVNK